MYLMEIMTYIYSVDKIFFRNGYFVEISDAHL